MRDYDEMFANASYEKLGNLSYRKQTTLPNYTLTITVCCYCRTRKAKIRVLLSNEFIRIARTYVRDFTQNIISNCRLVEKAYSNMMFLKDFQSILKRINVNV